MKKVAIVSEVPLRRDSVLFNYLKDFDYKFFSILDEKPDKKPKAKELNPLIEEVNEQIDNFKPMYCLLLGASPVKARLGKLKMKDTRGQWTQNDKDTDDTYYFTTYAPSVVFAQPEKEVVLRRDLKHFRDVVLGRRKIDAPKTNIKIIRTIDELNECFADIIESKWLDFDIEGTGLEYWRSHEYITMIVLTTKNYQWILPLGHRQSPFKRPKVQQQIMSLLDDLIREHKIKTSAHNGKFDCLWLKWKYGMNIQLTFDTMLAHYALDENSLHGLKYLSSLYFGAPYYDLPLEEKIGGASLTKLGHYAGFDGLYTRKLRLELMKEFKDEEEVKNVFNKLLMPASRALVDMEHRGVYVKVDQMDETLNQLNTDREEVARKLDSVKSGVNWNSPKQLAEVLFGDLGLDPIEMTASGAPSTAESILLRLTEFSEVPSLILKYREITKLMQFIESWKEKMDENNRLHPSFKLHSTVTGRLSCSEPNLQQVPRDKRIRSLIGAPPGWVFVEADYSQVELRVAAMLSDDPTLKRIFQTGGDPHGETAEIVSGKTRQEVGEEGWKEWRKKAKAVNFGFLYGMGWRKFKDYARDKYGVHLSDQEAQQYRERFFEKYSSLPRWHQKQRRIAQNHGFVFTPMGRKRRLPDAQGDDHHKVAQAERQAINSPVQSFASDMAVAAMTQIHQQIDHEICLPVGLVHDAILFEVREDKLDEVLPQIKHIMENPDILDILGIELTVPIEAEVTVGDWGIGKVWEG